MAKHLIFEIADDDEHPQLLHVILVAATEMSFDISFAGRAYSEVLRDICYVAPSMMGVDAALMEGFDDAFRTKPNPIQEMHIKKFIGKYRGALSNVDVDFLEEELGGDP